MKFLSLTAVSALVASVSAFKAELTKLDNPENIDAAHYVASYGWNVPVGTKEGYKFSAHVPFKEQSQGLELAFEGKLYATCDLTPASPGQEGGQFDCVTTKEGETSSGIGIIEFVV